MGQAVQSFRTRCPEHRVLLSQASVQVVRGLGTSGTQIFWKKGGVCYRDSAKLTTRFVRLSKVTRRSVLPSKALNIQV